MHLISPISETLGSWTHADTWRKLGTVRIYVYGRVILLCIYIYTHVHTHTHTHKYIYIYIYIGTHREQHGTVWVCVASRKAVPRLLPPPSPNSPPSTDVSPRRGLCCPKGPRQRLPRYRERRSEGVGGRAVTKADFAPGRRAFQIRTVPRPILKQAKNG